jgi:hypothetical protein
MANAFIVLKWLNAKCTSLVTTTPVINTTADLGGILGILQRRNIWDDAHLEAFGVDRNYNPFCEGSDQNESKWLRCSQEALRKFILSKGR